MNQSRRESLVCPDAPEATAARLPPDDLGPGGTRLWQTMTQAHDLTTDEFLVLEDCARRWDALTRTAEAGVETGHRFGQYGRERHPGLI